MAIYWILVLSLVFRSFVRIRVKASEFYFYTSTQFTIQLTDYSMIGQKSITIQIPTVILFFVSIITSAVSVILSTNYLLSSYFKFTHLFTYIRDPNNKNAWYLNVSNLLGWWMFRISSFWAKFLILGANSSKWNVTPRIWVFGGQQSIVAHCGSPSSLPSHFFLFLEFFTR